MWCVARYPLSGIVGDKSTERQMSLGVMGVCELQCDSVSRLISAGTDLVEFSGSPSRLDSIYLPVQNYVVTQFTVCTSGHLVSDNSPTSLLDILYILTTYV